METKLISKIYRTIQARENCKNNNQEWFKNHSDTLDFLNSCLPSGSGIDAGCKIDLNESNENKIVITFGYHFMNEDGYYDGWEDYKLICKPTFDGLNLKIQGKNRNMIKDYLYDTFDYYLNLYFDTDTNKVIF